MYYAVPDPYLDGIPHSKIADKHTSELPAEHRLNPPLLDAFPSSETLSIDDILGDLRNNNSPLLRPNMNQSCAKTPYLLNEILQLLTGQPESEEGLTREYLEKALGFYTSEFFNDPDEGKLHLLKGSTKAEVFGQEI
jgi:hypothetical protein